MATPDDPGLLQWAIGGLATAGTAALAWLSRSNSVARGELWEQIDAVKRDYVRRDDMGATSAALERIEAEQMRQRDRLHDLSNTVMKFVGQQGRRGADE